MIWYLIRRVALLIPTLLGISVAVFLMVQMVPGDPALVMLGERATPESLEMLRQELGLDQPVHVQLWRYLKGLITGDLGRSIKSHTQVRDELTARFPATFELTVVSMLFACGIGVTIGVISAVRRGSVLDALGMTASLAGVSMPIFWLGLVMILWFAVGLGAFPVSGRLGSFTYIPSVTGLFLVDSLLAGDLAAFVDVLHHLILPSITLGTVPAAVIVRMTRSSVLEVIQEDYVRTAWAKGLSERAVIVRHALRNASIPVLTVISLQFGYLLGGAVITETIFAWPGIGRWLLLAVHARDFPAIQGGVVVVATTFVTINLITDLLYAWLDPRISYSGSGR
ncbi:MAG: peptide ABC transporter permease [Gemmatimonadetes bacterium]|jgi:peptide/nickel transport system permease protein|nr:peptide ABC transporter permease [Gemmatimonadota bacterium]HCK09382.1 peptide ABC transporter permease [Candidatus Latescibacterota bacterium]